MSQIASIKQEFERYLSICLEDISDSKIKEAMQYSLLSGGKRMRPLLLLCALRDYNVDYKQAMPVAAAIEMIHTYSLIHDDLPAMDNDVLRRGRPTCHIQFDEATAILAGDALLTQAFAMVMKSPYDAQIKNNLIVELAAASGGNGMILGQHYDLTNEHNDQLDEATIILIDRLKTGKLIALPLRMAVYIANQREDMERMDELGHELGIAFQIQDDILNVTSSSDVLGKSVNTDCQQGKSTYVSLLGIAKAKEESMRRYEHIYQLEANGKHNHDSLRALLDTLFQRDY